MDDDSQAPVLVRMQLIHAEGVLAAAGSPAPRAEARSLLGSLLRVSTALLLAQPDRQMTAPEVETYTGWIAQRAKGEAMAHITGHLAFMGLDITTSRHVQLPPPGAQRVVEIALEWGRWSGLREIVAAEVGAGCGAISLALVALEPRFTRIYAVEPSTAALQAAEANGARYLLNLVISWLEGEGLDAVPELVDLIVCTHPDRIDLAQVPAKLRTGGTLICAVGDARRPAAHALLVHGFSRAPIWVEGQGDAPALAIAQLRNDHVGN